MESKFGGDGRNKNFYLFQNLTSGFSSIRQNIKDINKYKIQTYPRLTIYDITKGEDKEDQLIFDSVSFSRINRVLSVYDKRFKTTLANNKEIVKSTISNIPLQIWRLFF